MNKRAQKVLEYDKILNIISGMAMSEDAKKAVEELLPSDDFDTVEYMQNQMAQASSMLAMHGAAPISPLRNIVPALKRTVRGGSMSMSELLQTLFPHT